MNELITAYLAELRLETTQKLTEYLHGVDCPQHIAEASLARHAAWVDARFEEFWREVVGHDEHETMH